MIDLAVSDAFGHIAIAVCLSFASNQIANIYAMQVNLQVPLPPYPRRDSRIAIVSMVPPGARIRGVH